MSGRPTLIVFARAPVLGRAKTRLAAGIGPASAWRVKRTLDALTLRRVGRDPRWRTRLAVAPDAAAFKAFPGVWPGPRRLPRAPQGQGDLGRRLARAMRAQAAAGPVLVIGADLPDLRASDIARSLRALKRADAVLGPARDGGFWLIGLAARAARRVALDGVRWSSPHTLSDTLAALPAAWRVRLLDEREDVDDAASYRRFRRGTRAR